MSQISGVDLTDTVELLAAILFFCVQHFHQGCFPMFLLGTDFITVNKYHC